MEILVEYMAKGFMVMLAVCMPCVLVAAAVGLVVGILQAVTQIQEQTIAAAPKIVLVFLTIIILGGYFLKLLQNYLYEGTNLAFQVVPKVDEFVLPSDYYKYTRPFDAEMRDKINNNGSLNKANFNQGKILWNEKSIRNEKVYVKANQATAVEPNFIEKIKIQKNK